MPSSTAPADADVAVGGDTTGVSTEVALIGEVDGPVAGLALEVVGGDADLVAEGATEPLDAILAHDFGVAFEELLAAGTFDVIVSQRKNGGNR